MKINTAANRQQITRNVLIAAAAVAVLIAGYSVYAYSAEKWPFQADESSSTAATDDSEIRDTNDVDYSEPTEQEVSEGQSAKQRSLEAKNNPIEAPDSNPGTTGKQTVAVGVPSAGIFDGALEVRAFTNGAIESGTCKVTATKRGTSTRVSESSSAFIDASTTQCEPIRIATSKLSGGTWDVLVEFTSATHSGKSDTIEVQIP